MRNDDDRPRRSNHFWVIYLFVAGAIAFPFISHLVTHS